jgi:hypothetical protein
LSGRMARKSFSERVCACFSGRPSDTFTSCFGHRALLGSTGCPRPLGCEAPQGKTNHPDRWQGPDVLAGSSCGRRRWGAAPTALGSRARGVGLRRPRRAGRPQAPGRRRTSLRKLAAAGSWPRPARRGAPAAGPRLAAGSCSPAGRPRQLELVADRPARASRRHSATFACLRPRPWEVSDPGGGLGGAGSLAIRGWGRGPEASRALCHVQIRRATPDVAGIIARIASFTLPGRLCTGGDGARQGRQPEEVREGRSRIPGPTSGNCQGHRRPKLDGRATRN